MTNPAIEARRAYQRQWAEKNPDKLREYKRRYWEKKAAQMNAEAAKRATIAAAETWAGE